MKDLRKKLKGILSLELSPTKAFIVYLMVAVVFIAPIILANVYYLDDYVRSSTGTYNWTAVGRPLADLLMSVVSSSFGSTHADVGWFTQFATIPLLAIGGVVLLVNTQPKISALSVMIGLFVVVNPFLLANILYRYDALFMVIAYLLSIAAASYQIVPKNKLKQSITAGLLYLVAFFLYQPMVFVAIPIIFLIFFRDVYKKHPSKSILFNLGVRFAILAASVLAGYILTKVFIPDVERSSLVPLDGQFFVTAYGNIKEIVLMIVQYIATTYWPVYGAVVVLACVGYLLMLVDSLRGGIDVWKVLVAVVILVSPAVLICLIAGPVVVLENQVVSWRVIPSFGLLVVVALSLGCACISYFTNKPYVAGVVVGIVSLMLVGSSLITSFMIGQMVNRNNSFTVSRMNLVAGQIDANGLSDYRILTVGSVGVAGSYHSTAKTHAYLEQFIPRNNVWIPRYVLRDLGYSVIADMKLVYPEINTICNQDIRPDYTSRHTDIYRIDMNTAVIHLKGGLMGRLCV